jgi:hypothetical protein
VTWALIAVIGGLVTAVVFLARGASGASGVADRALTEMRTLATRNEAVATRLLAIESQYADALAQIAERDRLLEITRAEVTRERAGQVAIAQANQVLSDTLRKLAQSNPAAASPAVVAGINATLRELSAHLSRLPPASPGTPASSGGSDAPVHPPAKP